MKMADTQEGYQGKDEVAYPGTSSFFSYIYSQLNKYAKVLARSVFSLVVGVILPVQSGVTLLGAYVQTTDVCQGDEKKERCQG